MPLSARAYLLDRFRADSAALYQRATSLSAVARKSAAPTPGPDAATSHRMALACDAVVEMIDSVSESFDAAHSLASIVALLPLLEHRASQEPSSAAVRAVYVGAATRIREVQAAEARATTNGLASESVVGASDNPHGQSVNGDDSLHAADDSDADDPSDDDDDVDDDDLPAVDRG